MLRQIEATAAPSRADWVRVQVVRDPIELAGMRAEWSALLEQSDAAVFNGWDWLYPYYQRVVPGLEPWVMTARDRSGKLVGLLPLARERRRIGPVSIRRLCFLGEEWVGSDYLDAVTLRERRHEVIRAFARELLDRCVEWDLLDLNDFDERSSTPEIVGDLFGGTGFDVRAVDCRLCPNETFLEGESFEQFLRRTRRQHNYLGRRKWLEAQVGFRVEVTTDPAKIARPLSEFFRLHALRWEEDGGSSGIIGPRVEAFHRDPTHFLSQAGKLRLYTAWLGEKALASVYGIVHRDTFSYYQSGMDPEWRSKSVGMVLVGATVENAIRSGLRHYDFLRGTEASKFDWVSKVRRTTGLRIAPSTGVGAWFVMGEDGVTAAKALLKRALPEATLERLRRLRRQWAAATA